MCEIDTFVNVDTDTDADANANADSDLILIGCIVGGIVILYILIHNLLLPRWSRKVDNLIFWYYNWFIILTTLLYM